MLDAVTVLHVQDSCRETCPSILAAGATALWRCFMKDLNGPSFQQDMHPLLCMLYMFTK